MEYRDYREYYKLPKKKTNKIKLKEMPVLKIRCGVSGGLPFNTLMTDVVSGCLAIDNVCYGNCTACDFWVKQGYDFGNRNNNIFDKNIFISDLRKLPKDVKWLRQGWVSDCSFSNDSWQLVADISNILASYNIFMLIITKIHKYPSDSILETLKKNNTEIRVSVSALDSPEEHEKRIKFLKHYKNIGGRAIPYLMSAKYNNSILNNNQNIIVQEIIENDFIAGEHPLRIDYDNPIYSLLAKGGFSHFKFKKQYWFGRIMGDIPNFVLPPPTHLENNYCLKFFSFNECRMGELPIFKNLPTYNDLKNNSNILTKEMNKHAAYIVQEN